MKQGRHLTRYGVGQNAVGDENPFFAVPGSGSFYSRCDGQDNQASQRRLVGTWLQKLTL